ncbi:MAG: MarC family NAAT transporter [Bacteroidota bacterium]
MEIFLASFTALFSVINPFGAVPVFVASTQGVDKKRRNEQALKTGIYMILILVAFFFAGTFILDFFAIRIEDIRIAGGLMIAKTAFELLTPGSHKGKPLHKDVQKESVTKDDISFTPMAMPLLAGPGSIAVTIGLFHSTTMEIDYIYTIAAIVIIAGITYLILRSSYRLNKFLGKTGMAALSRMMGFIILSIAVSMILNGTLSLIQKFMTTDT